MGVHGRAEFAWGFLVLGLASLLPQRDQHLKKTCLGDLAVSVKLEGRRAVRRTSSHVSGFSIASRSIYNHNDVTVVVRVGVGVRVRPQGAG